MKRIILAAVAASTFAGAATAATGWYEFIDANGAPAFTINVEGNAPLYCRFALTAQTPVANAVTGTTWTIELGNLTDGNGRAAALSATANTAITCNTGAVITIASTNGGLLNATAAPSGFWTNKVNYTVSLPWLGTFTSAQLAATATVTKATAFNASNSQFRLDTVAGGANLVYGDYADTITLTIDPTI